MGENLKKQIAKAVRNIKWSYAILWSPSTESGVLEWGDGYYNGVIKTRKTILSSMDIKGDDQTICQRSDQLRELYESLLSGNDTTTTATRRPLAALSPEDLTDVEWFYLVCMSFVFSIGQGLPGRSLANGETIWISNANHVDTEVFSRSLLAKSADIKTVVCFPFLDGVIELGVTDSVTEDLNLIQQVKALLLESSSSLLADLPPLTTQGENIEFMSPCGTSNVFSFEHLSDVMGNDQLSNNCVIPSMTSSDCFSQTIVDPINRSLDLKSDVIYDTNLQAINGVQECEQQGGISRLDRPISEDLYFQNVLSSPFEKSDQGFLQQCDQQDMVKKSGFVGWRKGGNKKTELSEVRVTSQYMLKKILFEVPKMHSAKLIESKEDGVRKDESRKQEVPNTNHVLAERRRREKVNERFSTLRSLIPSISKADKISILDDTITYLKELERRVNELESCQESIGMINTKKKRKTVDIEERTSNNYGSDINEGGTNKNKRNGREITKEGDEQESGQVSSRVSLVDNIITISRVDEEILINVSCLWRESLLLQIIDAMTNLHLDSQSVNSSTLDGILSLKIQSKVKGCMSMPVEAITETLVKVIRNRS